MSDLESDELRLEPDESEDDGTKDFEGQMEEDANYQLQYQVLKMIINP